MTVQVGDVVEYVPAGGSKLPPVAALVVRVISEDVVNLRVFPDGPETAYAVGVQSERVVKEIRKSSPGAKTPEHWRRRRAPAGSLEAAMHVASVRECGCPDCVPSKQQVDPLATVHTWRR